MNIFRCILLLAICLIRSAHASALLDDPEALLHLAEELRPQLKLSASAATQWLQAESKTRELLREQRARRERFAIEVQDQLHNGQIKIDAIAKRIDSEDSIAFEERHSIRQYWISALKDLNENQEAQCRDFLRAALDAPASVAPAAPPPTKNTNMDESPKQRGGRGSRSGGFGSGGGGGFGGGMPRF